MDQIFKLLGHCMETMTANPQSKVPALVTVPIEPAPVLPQASSSTSVKRGKFRKPHDKQSAGSRASLANSIKSGSEHALVRPLTAKDGQVHHTL